jgi:hypothetical protein
MKRLERKQVVAKATQFLGGKFETRPARFAQAYLAMAEHANYRPAAPGDGCGHTYLSKDEASDPERLAKEAIEYARGFDAEEDERAYNIGCSNFSTNRALVFVIEAARSLCGGKDDLADSLLKMAINEIGEART